MSPSLFSCSYPVEHLPHVDELYGSEVIGVEPNGELTPETVEATRRKRCAQRDTRRSDGRSKRFALSGTSKWDKKHFTGLHELSLKWFVSEYTNDIPKAIIRSTIQKAFQLWAKQANERNLPKVTFRFEEAASQADADINILWAEGAHGDQYEGLWQRKHPSLVAIPLPEVMGNALQDFNPVVDYSGGTEQEGPEFNSLTGKRGKVQGAGWMKRIEGEVERNPRVRFLPNQGDRRFFPYVLAHEIGHALGLQHAKKQEAIMYPYYKNMPLDEIKLDLDDKCAINWNYVGTSKFCLFVWLMSEIVPIHNNSDQMASSNHLNNSPKQRIKAAKRILKQTRIPRCLASNDIQWLIEARLQKFLHFPPAESKTYSEVLCNFLLGLHAYRGGPDYLPGDSLEKEFNGVMKEVSEFGPVSAASVRRMARGARRRREHGKPSVLDVRPPPPPPPPTESTDCHRLSIRIDL
ncbi:unnamed protein product [Nippostrongylus brasiliensis]|uniref:Matrilysin (inferred by orthology to a human protein) n=1 Tax=Nippostrongylus brasiliensis TaxID=27835 RepID=A0A158R185_NIPBR|nr:unnamed protein product [Nippostrongylus brasiliensis]